MLSKNKNKKESQNEMNTPERNKKLEKKPVENCSNDTTAKKVEMSISSLKKNLALSLPKIKTSDNFKVSNVIHNSNDSITLASNPRAECFSSNISNKSNCRNSVSLTQNSKYVDSIRPSAFASLKKCIVLLAPLIVENNDFTQKKTIQKSSLLTKDTAESNELSLVNSETSSVSEVAAANEEQTPSQQACNTSFAKSSSEKENDIDSECNNIAENSEYKFILPDFYPTVEIEEVDDALKENSSNALELMSLETSAPCFNAEKQLEAHILSRHAEIIKHEENTKKTLPDDVKTENTYCSEGNLKEHLQSHTGEANSRKFFKCQYCDKNICGLSLLKIHMRSHTGEKPFGCDFCPKKFSYIGSLSRHHLTHTGERPYSCDECGKSFSVKATLKRHLRIHTGRPYECTFCGKRFVQIGGLKAHMFFHTRENGFKCDDCGKEFSRKSCLSMHHIRVHLKLKTYVCEICNRAFPCKDDLMRHTIRKHASK